MITAFAPGRVNLIGEFTDYNEGLALPFAIPLGVTVTATPAQLVSVEALDYGEADSFTVDAPGRAPGWRAFVRGAVAELQHGGFKLSGAHLTITGDVPRGSGLSSSAALEVALCLALLGLAGQTVDDRVALAQICSRVENDWVGARTGLLDQLASLCSEPDHALLIDFRSLELEHVPLRLGGYHLVTLDSGERHSLKDSGYNTRRDECREACRLLGVSSLRDATLDATFALPEPYDGRARHIVTENARVVDAIGALKSDDMLRLGELLDASHASLRDDFEVSTDAVEATVRRLHAAGALGARLVGGGFGGSVLALFGPDVLPPEGALGLTPGPGAGLRP